MIGENDDLTDLKKRYKKVKSLNFRKNIFKVL